jgi:alkylation response protein AidB-like acyl-CoA dehydrogenase
MNLEFTEAELAFQRDVRAWFEQHVPASLRHRAGTGQMSDKAGPARLGSQFSAVKGWLAVGWPAQHGGPGWSATQRYIFDLERARAGAPPVNAIRCLDGRPGALHLRHPGAERAAPARHRQRHHALVSGLFRAQFRIRPRLAENRLPCATATPTSSTARKSGQRKGHWADWCFCLVRTDATVKQQMGISFLLIDMKTPGIEIRPIHSIDGHHHLNEVYFTDVRVPVAQSGGQRRHGLDHRQIPAHARAHHHCRRRRLQARNRTLARHAAKQRRKLDANGKREWHALGRRLRAPSRRRTGNRVWRRWNTPTSAPLPPPKKASRWVRNPPA